jgi:hypothetical protein
MTRSHVLLHCSNERLRAARAKAWEGKGPRGVRVLLVNPRWERQFVKFLELSGVGRVVADGTGEDGARAAKMDESRAKDKLSSFLASFYISFVRGACTPSLTHSAPPRAKDFLCNSRPADSRGPAGFLCLS